jgi:hypothetical protein
MAAALPQFVGDQRRLHLASASNPEFELLRACCADIPEQERNRQIEELFGSGLNWDRLARMAGHHGILPRVFRILMEYTASLPNSIPAPALENLKRLEQANSRRALWLTSELAAIAERLTSRGVRFLTYKGPVLGQLLYSDVTIRQFGDLDLLIHPEGVANAVRIVCDSGYWPQLKLTPAEEKAYRSIGYEYVFDGPLGRNLLEIKWQILPRFYSIDFDIEKIFSRASFVNIGGINIASFSTEDLLLVLCVHAAKHGWEKFSWLCDIAALCRQSSFDWNEVQQKAYALGIERILAINMVFTNKLLESPLPEPVAAYVRSDTNVNLFARKITARIIACQNCDVTKKAYFREFAQLRERRTDRMRFWWQFISTPNVGEWQTAKLRNPQSVIYRGIRIFRLVRKMLFT